jgi:hypothetical protein
MLQLSAHQIAQITAFVSFQDYAFAKMDGPAKAATTLHAEH